MTVQPDFDVRCQTTGDQSETVDDDVADATAGLRCAGAGGAVGRNGRGRATSRRAARPRPLSPNLLATAEQAPQTRGLRRATVADAQTRLRRHAGSRRRAAGIRTRQHQL